MTQWEDRWLSLQRIGRKGIEPYRMAGILRGEIKWPTQAKILGAHSSPVGLPESGSLECTS